ncbi:RecE family exodeoxyribonuclease [Citrobacter sp. Cf140]|uniref:RecE family exodeoxyribonuclease n=1 Tax=Citrobacter TaxID=544 RepID=UPI001A2973AF|nr:RecE family exodeoxyribonuclease [Citrobacter sp. Cf140]MEB1122474.1 RecE family exodeoxyribonuclease [Citrobacter freundii]MDM3100041.1 PD-(D/E)XK nuclease-like domain-containing protein [Citrobacter sp. Cf140]HAU5660024.1 exodeoxyribonuclease [Citrobacter freundii]HBV7900258.1 PD-(D/E)XK nuclease-like domain-containing protein [Citrobacter freundii]HCB2471309.1 PD-(D/E)XK nuclease-like domain-containing protein [Citrobacter freundii]
MSELTPYFVHHRAKKQSGEPSAVFWESAKTENRALRDADNALEDAGKDPASYFKPLVTNFPVVNELPPEGEISFTFCNFYQLGDDGMTWSQIPGVTLPAHPGEKVVEGTDESIVNGVDTSTGEIVDQSQLDHSDDSGNDGLDVDENDDEYTRYPIVQMSFRKQLLSQFTSDALRHHLTQTEHKEIVGLEMDTDNGYVQNLILAAESVEGIKKLDMPFLWKYTKAMKDVFDPEKRHELSLMLHFSKAWIETTHIDRGTLVKEWIAGNRISKVLPPNAPEKAPEKKEELPAVTAERYKRAVAQSLYNLNVESCIARIYPDAEPGSITIEQLKSAKDLIDSRDDIQAKVIKVISHINDIMDYDALSIFGVTRAIDWSDCLNIGPVVLRNQARSWLAENGIYSNGKKSNGYSEWDDDSRAARQSTAPSDDEVGKQLAAQRGEFVEGISDPNDPKWVKTEIGKPEEKPELVTKVAEGIFDVSALMQNSATHGTKKAAETTSNVQVQETDSNEKQAGDALHTGESDLGTGEESNTGQQTDVNQNTDSVSQNSDSVNHIEPKSPELVPEPQPVWPTHFEPGRYENLPNEVYHSANGISSTQLKDVRISPMYYYGRHIAKTIPREQNDAMLRGTIIHSYVLEPERFESEFAVPEEVPAEVVSTSGDLVSIIKEYNAGLPSLATPDELKAYIEELNKTLTPPLSLSGSADETANLYMSLPVDFQRIPDGTKHTASAQKACIKEYNASLQPLLKVSGTREQLLDQIATIDPEYAEKERAKFIPYNVSGTKEQLTEIVRAIRPDVVTADDWHQQQEEASQGKTMISLDMYAQAKNISAALQAHPSASRLLTHPSRQSEVSYFGFDEETGLEIRVRPDLEITLPHARIGGDLKTTSLGYVKQDELKARLHREIISRDYHLSAAMYCDTAELDQFFWIFVNRDEGYHWIAVVEASPDLLELGRKEYRRALRTINDCTMSGNWPAPITEDYTDELNDFDLRRLEALGSL